MNELASLFKLFNNMHLVNLMLKRLFSQVPDRISNQKLKNILILSKISRLQFEKQLNPSLDDTGLKKKLITKGSNFDWLYQRHEEHTKYLNSIAVSFGEAGFNVKIVTKPEYTNENLKWSDLVLTAGGDGTFLLGASKILCPRKPILGINTDPSCSQGFLCAPKDFVFNLKKLVGKIKNRQFEFTYRQRLRIELSQIEEDFDPHTRMYPLNAMNPSESHYENRFHEHLTAQNHPKEQPNLKFYQDRSIVKDNHPNSSITDPFSKEEISATTILPVRALNEVFLGEALSARVSYYEISFDGGPKVKQKSSGLTVCTGTGSTSWSFNICGLHKSSIVELFQILKQMKPSLSQDKDLQSLEFANLIANRYNSHLAFDPADKKLAYIVRDPVRNSIFSAGTVRGYCHKIVIRSRMMDAHLVVDGDSAFHFNDGAVASIYMVPDEDQLLCLKFPNL